MSYILDALRKAEQERKLGQPPTIMSIADRASPAAKHRYWLWLALIIAINAGVLIIFWPGLLVQREFAGTERELPDENRAGRNAPDAMSAQIVRAESPSPYEFNTGDGSDTGVERTDGEAALTDSLVEAAPETEFSRRVMLADELLATERPPLWQALAPRIRAELPPLNLDIHVYSESTDKRFVLINSVRYQQGDWLNEGPLLEAITEEGVILNHREQRFRLLVQR